MNKIGSYFYNIKELTKRNMLIFIKNKTTVFFSLIAPILILLIYILFMGDIQLESIKNASLNNSLSDGQLMMITNSWMVSGIVGLSCLTVGLNSLFIVIADRENKVVDDFIASPVKIINLTLSYFISSFLLTFTICFIFLLVGISYLYITNNIIFSLIELIHMFLLLIISTLSSVITLMFITLFFKTTASIASFTGIFSALIGFLIGAYMPISIMSTGIQNVANLIPGSHSTALFRQIFMDKAFYEIRNDASFEFINSMKEMFGYNLELFNIEFNQAMIYIYLTISILLFFILYIIVKRLNVRRIHRNR